MMNGTSSEAYLGPCQTSKMENFAKIVIRLKPLNICGALRDLVPFAQFKKKRKTPMEDC